MNDIYIGLLVLTVCSAGAFFAGRSLARVLSPGWCDLAALTVFAGLVAYILLLWDHVWLARLLPFSNLIIIGNWFPVATGLQAGLVWQRIAHARFRRGLSVTALTVVSFYAVVHPLQGDVPECRNQWSGDVCLQTSPYTCSAASAATLLRAHNLDATEQEMAELCLTRRGTTWQGLYRGLVRKTAGTAWRVEVFNGSVSDLALMGPAPVLLNVGLPVDQEVDPNYIAENGWIPGMRHTVVFFGFTEFREALMGEPTWGLEHWRLEDLQLLWKGQGLRLVPRDSVEQPGASGPTEIASLWNSLRLTSARPNAVAASRYSVASEATAFRSIED